MTILNRLRLSVLLLIPCCWGGLLAADETARVEGRVVRKGGIGVAGVVVLINELKLTDVTGGNGRFSIGGIPLGKYTVFLTLGDNTADRELLITEGGTKEVELEVDWKNVGVQEEVTVTAVERAAKIVDAPAAVTSIPQEEIAQQASHGQVPKVLEFTPGAEITQSGLYDFNFNTRGFNSSLNRRVSTYIDGRDVGVVLLGAQEWASISGGLDDVANLEFIRGPSAALYGANASSGVVNIVTKSPRNSLGTLVRATGGELDTRSLDFRRADELGRGWYSKVLGGIKKSGDYSISRNPDVVAAPEYSEFCMLIGETNCLPEEKTLFREQDNEIRYGGVRFDKYLSDETSLVFEAGISTIKGPVLQTGIGRAQIRDAKRPFYRFNFSNPNWNVLAHFSTRDGDQANLVQALRVDYELITQETRYGVELQGHWKFLEEKLRFVVGAAHTEERVDSVNPDTGKQTVVYEPIATNRQAVFSQLDWSVSPHVKLVFAGRVDKSTLHPTQFSPKAAMVYSINSKHSLRATYNRAFQVANYSEFFLHTRISAFPMGGFVRTICEGPILPEPVDCGVPAVDANGQPTFIPILAVGNDDLRLEKTSAWEIGYSGLIANRVFVTVDYYNSKNEDFITDLVPQVGTILGNLDGCVDSAGAPQTDPTKCPINDDYRPWVAPQEAETTILFGTLTVAQALRNAVDNSVGGTTLGFRLAQDLNGDTVVVGRTYTNVGNVATQGVDLGIQYFVNPSVKVQASYSWFDFTIQDSNDDTADILLPNSPANKASLEVSVNRKRWSGSIGGRWVEGFPWSAGVFQGPVKDYSTIDLSGSFAFNDLVRLGVNVANVADNVHRQTFGGDLLSRRALAHLTFTW